MPLAPDHSPVPNRAGKFVQYTASTVLPNSQMKLFDIALEGPDYDPGEVLTFPLFAVVELDVTGKPSVDTPDILIKRAFLYNEGSCRPIRKIEPEEDQTTVASSLLAGSAIITNTIYARWDTHHADPLSDPGSGADYSDIAGTLGDSGDWIAND